MSSPNIDENLYFPLSPLYSPLPTQLAPQLEDCKSIFMNGANLDNIFLQNHGEIPTVAPQPNYSPDARESFGFLSNLLQVSQTPATLPDQYPSLQHELLQNPPQFPYDMTQEMANSFIPTEKNVEEMNIFGNGEAAEAIINKSSSLKRKPARNTSKKQKQAEETSDKGNSCQSSGGGNGNMSNECKRRRLPRQYPLRIFGERSSRYRGVSRYTGRYEAFLWDNSDRKRKPKTVYIGGYNDEESAARAYDLAALKLWGEHAPLNFPISNYAKDLLEMQFYSKNEYFHNIRRKSRGFAKGASIYRGVSRNSDLKKWQARIGKGKDIKGIYLGTFDTEEEAARAYDVASIRLKRENAITNFDLNEYDMTDILQSSKLPIGKGASKLLLKSSVDDVVRKKRNANDKNSFLYFKEDDSGSLPPEQLMFPEEFQSRVAPEDHSMQHQQNLYSSNQENQTDNSSFLPGFQNPDEFQTDPLEGFNSFGSDMSNEGNLSFDFNVEFPSNVDLDGHSTISGTTEKGIQELQPFEFTEDSSAPDDMLQDSSLPFIKEHDQNPGFPILHGCQNPVGFQDNLAEIGIGNCLETDKEFTNSNGENFPGEGVVEGCSAVATSCHNFTNELSEGFEEMQLCQNFQSLLAKKGQDSLNSNQIEDLTTQNLHEDPTNSQTYPMPFHPLRGGYRTEVTCDQIFEGVPSSMEIKNNSTSGIDESDNGAAMVENPKPGVEVNFLEDYEHDISICLQTLNELGPLCFQLCG